MNKDQIIQSLDSEIDRLKQARALLSGTSDTYAVRNGSNGRRGPRHMSAQARARISAAQKARWAKVKGRRAGSSGAATGTSPKKPRRMSAAGRARIAAAQRARWAKVKAQSKKK